MKNKIIQSALIVVIITNSFCNKMKLGSQLTLQAKNRLSAQIRMSLQNKISSESMMDNYLGEEENMNNKRMQTEEAAPTGEGDELAVQKEGWLMVSSQSYMDPQRFPIVKGEKKNSFKMVEMTGGYVSISDGQPDPNTPPGSYFRKNQVYPKEAVPSESQFYFRLSKNNLYYSASQKDMVVLGAISISNIEQVSESDNQFSAGNCIAVKDGEMDAWTLCGASEKEMKEWECAIDTQLGIDCKPQVVEDTSTHIAQPVFIVPTPSPYCNEGWDYNNHGEEWQCLCSEGKAQSPIDIKLLCNVPGVMLPETKLNQSAIFQFQEVKSQDWQMIWEEHMVKMTCKGDCKEALAKVIDVDYNEFECNELQFHTPSEHTLSGSHYPMEIQAICTPLTQQAFREKLVIAWLVNNQPGGTNQFIDNMDVLDLPNKRQPIKEVNKENKNINLQGMFLNDSVDKFYDSFNYYYYTGSLTSPQCDQNVRWIIAADPIPLGISIYQMFNDANGKFTPKYSGNNRKLQNRNERRITFYDSEASGCGKPTLKKRPQIGHFEKLESKIYDLYYLDGAQHSGLKTSKMMTDENVNTIRKNKKNIPMISKILQGTKK